MLSKSNKSKKPEPNPIETAIGKRAKPKEIPVAPSLPTQNTPTFAEVKIQDEPSPQEMVTLEELNREAEERYQDPYPEEPTPEEKRILNHAQIVTGKEIPALKSDLPPATKNSSLESPPQKIDKEFHPVSEPIPNIEKLPSDFKVKHTYDTGVAGCVSLDNHEKHVEVFEETAKKLNVNLIEQISPAEDIELTALRKFIMSTGFVLSTVAYHIVSLCSQPMMIPSTITWDFKDRANVPDMVFALLKQPGYIEGIWPALKVVMGTNIGNETWTAGIATTLAFFDTVRMLPVLKEMKVLEDEKKS